MARRLLLLNGLAAIGAVVNHATGWGFTSLIWWAHRYDAAAGPDFSQVGTPTYYAIRGAEQLIMFTLPAFLFVSGYFVAFATGKAERLSWDKVGSRVRMLIIPYVLWSVVIFIGRFLEGSRDSLGGYATQLLVGRAAEPYYYIPLLTQLYLLAPVIVLLVRARWALALGLAAGLQAFVQLVRYPVLLGWDVPAVEAIARATPGWTFPHMVFWFVLGVYTGFNLPVVKAWAQRWRTVLPWATLALFALAFLEWEWLFAASGRPWVRPHVTLLDGFYAGACILTFVAYADSIPARPTWLDAIGERSFGIYLLHAPILELASRAAYHAVPALLAHQMVLLTLLVAAGVVVPLVLMRLVKQSPARPAYNYLFG